MFVKFSMASAKNEILPGDWYANDFIFRFFDFFFFLVKSVEQVAKSKNKNEIKYL